jgi:hypothetical protein
MTDGLLIKIQERMITYLAKFFSKLGICAKVGLMAGGLTGIALTIMDYFKQGLVLTEPESVYVSLAMAIFSWLLIVFILGLAFRYSFGSITLPTLINCLLTAFATVFISRLLGAFPLAWLLGMVIGLIIGIILCRLNYYLEK